MSNPTRGEVREAVVEWFRDEIMDYVDLQKKADPNDLHHTTWTPEVHDWWEGIVLGYIGRARLLHGAPVGEQALMKAATALFEMAVTMVLAKAGDVPAPGYPSGELRIWEW